MRNRWETNFSSDNTLGPAFREASSVQMSQSSFLLYPISDPLSQESRLSVFPAARLGRREQGYCRLTIRLATGPLLSLFILQWYKFGLRYMSTPRGAQQGWCLREQRGRARRGRAQRCGAQEPDAPGQYFSKFYISLGKPVHLLVLQCQRL